MGIIEIFKDNAKKGQYVDLDSFSMENLVSANLTTIEITLEFVFLCLHVDKIKS